MSPDDPRHGTNAGYNAHVKEGEDACFPCLVGAAQHAAHVRRLQAYGRWNPWVDPAPARAHVRRLLDSGMPLRLIAESAGVRGNRISHLIYGRNGQLAGRIRPEFAANILAVQPVASRVSGLGAARRTQALIAMGYSTGLLAEHLGVARARVHQIVRNYKPLIMRETHDRIAALYDTLCMVPPPRDTPADRQRASRALTAARQRGYAPPLAWDDIDDPNAEPYAAPKHHAAGRPVVRLNHVEDAEWMADNDENLTNACARLGIKAETLRVACTRAGRLDVYERLADREPNAANRAAVRAALRGRVA